MSRGTAIRRQPVARAADGTRRLPVYERAAVRWLRRFSAERTPTLIDFALAAQAVKVETWTGVIGVGR
jgi:hypothetical protein